MDIRIRRPSAHTDFVIDVAPLVDVLFTLLIFFSLTSSFLHESGIKVNLPEATAGVPIEHTRRIEIAVPLEGPLRVNDVEVAPEGLREFLSSIESADRERHLVVVKGDTATAYGRVALVLDTVKGLGFKNVAIATRSKK